jgi:hypothetical protein
METHFYAYVLYEKFSNGNQVTELGIIKFIESQRVPASKTELSGTSAPHFYCG